MKKEILLEWKENERYFEKKIERKMLYVVMDGIRQGFYNDNEVSTLFCNIIIPRADSIFIDKDRNLQMEVPFIQYKVGEEVKTVDIIRYHKIIWSILNGFFRLE